jgi:hypothetical protein
MDFNSTIDLIIKELREASDIIDDLKKYPEVPALQVELAKLKCKNAGEVIALLKTMKNIPPVQAAPALPNPEPAVKQQPPEEVRPEVHKEVPVTEHSAPKTDTPVTTIKEVAPVVPVIEKKKEKEKEKEKEKKQEETTKSIADKFTKEETSYYHQLAASSTDEEIADLLQSMPISSLTDAIGLNDKFLFIREIFNGNQNDYTQAISRLEKITTLSDANAIIMSYTGENTGSEAISQLLHLVKRKLQADE